jgi:dihydroflavonol-4-reductase
VRDSFAGAGSTVLVTGATGFTGWQLVSALRRRGQQVRALVRPATDATRLVDAGVQVVRGDITRAGDVDRATEGADTVYHLAALYRTAGHPDRRYWAVNVDGTRNVLDAAARHRVRRVVHCSTAGVHGAVAEIPCREDSPINPGDVYQTTKLEGERLAREAFRTGLPGVVVRPVGLYGPGDLRFLKLFRAIRSGRFRMFGPGTVPYHLTYIDDMVAGLLLCGERPAAVGQTYLLAGEQYLPLNELVRQVAEAVGVPPPSGHLPLWPLLAAARACEGICRPLRIQPPLYPRRAAFFLHPRAFASDKARRELGFVPRVPLREGLRRTVQWYQEQGLLTPGPLASQDTVTAAQPVRVPAGDGAPSGR